MKVGDRVICVDPGVSFLTKGKEYTIEGIRYNRLMIRSERDHCVYNYFSWRFRAVANTAFEVDLYDYIRSELGS